MRRSRSALLLALVSLAPVTRAGAQSARIDSLDAFVKSQMALRGVRGLSLAIVKDGRIALARAYGVIDDSTKAPVTTATLFQAGSISKPVSALGALRLVEQGRLSLDEDVNAKLTSWKVPANQFTATEKVTLRRLLSHTAGATVHGFPGYDVAGPIPTVVQVLAGTPPTNTGAIRIDTIPGSIWRYSGGGVTIAQLLVMDVTRQPYPQYMQTAVLGPIGMTSSTFEQPLPAARAALTATGYYADGSPVRGRWHVYPEMAAAGLWTTATDLAKFAIEIQQTLAGRGHGVLSRTMARQYVTEVKNGYALGVGVYGAGPTLRFGHGGRDEGFDALLDAGVETGDGVVVMINANDNTPMKDKIRDFVSRAWQFGGPQPPRRAPAATTAARIDARRLAEYAGYYEASENNMIAFGANADGSGMQILVDGRPAENLLAMDSATFGSSERPYRVIFGPRDHTVTMFPGEPRERRVPRVTPLPSTLLPMRETDPALAARIAAAMAALRDGRAAIEASESITAGAKKDFWNADATLAGFPRAAYLGDVDLRGCGIRRHGHEVARVRLYRMPADGVQRYLMVHLAADGDVTDYDTVLK